MCQNRIPGRDQGFRQTVYHSVWWISYMTPRLKVLGCNNVNIDTHSIISQSLESYYSGFRLLITIYSTLIPREADSSTFLRNHYPIPRSPIFQRENTKIQYINVTDNPTEPYLALGLSKKN